MAGPEQIRRHTGSHVAKPNESDFHDPTSPVVSARRPPEHVSDPTPVPVAERRPRVSVAAAALASVEEEYLDPIRRGRHDQCAEVAAIAGWYTARYPGRRGANDLAGGVEGLAGELHAIGRQAGVHVVHVAADDGPRDARLHLIFDPEVSIEAFLCVVRSRRWRLTPWPRARDQTSSTHRRTSTNSRRARSQL